MGKAWVGITEGRGGRPAEEWGSGRTLAWKETTRVSVRFISGHQGQVRLTVFNYNLINKRENKVLIKSPFILRCATPGD